MIIKSFSICFRSLWFIIIRILRRLSWLLLWLQRLLKDYISLIVKMRKWCFMRYFWRCYLRLERISIKGRLLVIWFWILLERSQSAILMLFRKLKIIILVILERFLLILPCLLKRLLKNVTKFSTIYGVNSFITDFQLSIILHQVLESMELKLFPDCLLTS